MHSYFNSVPRLLCFFQLDLTHLQVLIKNAFCLEVSSHVRQNECDFAEQRSFKFEFWQEATIEIVVNVVYSDLYESH